MIPQAIERAYGRSGITGRDGEALQWPRRASWPHRHWCPECDTRMECHADPCLLFEAEPCLAHSRGGPA